MDGNKLSFKVKAGYGVCDLGGNLFFTATAFVLLNFLTDSVGLAAGLAGTVLMIGRIWDAFYDPVIGYLSDRTSSRWGRRRPYIFIGSFPLFVTMSLMFINPAMFFGHGFVSAEHQQLLFVWGLVVYILLCTAYSTVNIPYTSLTPELTRDFHERTSLNGYRFGFAVIGTLLGAGAALPIVGAFPERNMGFAAMGGIFGAVMMITALLMVFATREPASTRPANTMGFVNTYLAVFRNKPYVMILMAYVFNIIAITIVSAVAIYYFKYIHNDESKTTIAMLILLVTAMLFIPVSVVLGKKVGKKMVYGAGMILFAVMLMIMYLWGHRYGINFSLAMMFVGGIGMGLTYAMPYAIVPDAIEYDYLVTGERREGAFYGIWTWALKIGQALAVFVMGWALSLTGYVADAAQTELAKLGIRLFLGPIPAAIYVIATVFIYLYPINEKRYNEIVAEIKVMEAKARA